MAHVLGSLLPQVRFLARGFDLAQPWLSCFFLELGENQQVEDLPHPNHSIFQIFF